MHPADPAVGEGKQPRLQELRAFGGFAWSSGVDSLGQEGFLVDVESGCFGVEVLELRPEPRWGLLLLLEHLALGDSAGVSKAATLCWGLLGHRGLPDMPVGWGWWHGDLPLERGEVNSPPL